MRQEIGDIKDIKKEEPIHQQIYLSFELVLLPLLIFLLLIYSVEKLCFWAKFLRFVKTFNDLIGIIYQFFMHIHNMYVCVSSGINLTQFLLKKNILFKTLLKLCMHFFQNTFYSSVTMYL